MFFPFISLLFLTVIEGARWRQAMTYTTRSPKISFTARAMSGSVIKTFADERPLAYKLGISIHFSQALCGSCRGKLYCSRDISKPQTIKFPRGTLPSLSSLFPLPIVPRALSFSFSPASPQHKKASAEERGVTLHILSPGILSYWLDKISFRTTPPTEICCLYSQAIF